MKKLERLDKKERRLGKLEGWTKRKRGTPEIERSDDRQDMEETE